MLTLLLMFAAVVVVALGWNLYRRFATGRISKFNDRRRESSRLVSHATFVDGNRHLPVALAVTQSTFFYENSDMEASLDLDRVREVEYDNELATGLAVASGKVLRLRSDSQTFEFVLPADAVAPWQSMLPARSERADATAADRVSP
jgi:hypothetical protein